MYLPFAVYCGKLTVCLPFTALNSPFYLTRLLRSNNGSKKLANTAPPVNGKSPLDVGNPSGHGSKGGHGGQDAGRTGWTGRTGRT